MADFSVNSAIFDDLEQSLGALTSTAPMGIVGQMAELL